MDIPKEYEQRLSRLEGRVAALDILIDIFLLQGSNGPDLPEIMKTLSDPDTLVKRLGAYGINSDLLNGFKDTLNEKKALLAKSGRRV